MRILLIYDLPMDDEKDRKIYNRFHKDITNFGFYMLQFSVYTKVLQNETVFKQQYTKLEKIIPTKGNIIILRITEKQYQDMIYLTGEKNKFDMLVGGKELVIFGDGK